MDDAGDWVEVSVTVNAPVITSVSPDQTVFSGDNFLLTCDANGLPQPGENCLGITRGVSNLCNALYAKLWESTMMLWCSFRHGFSFN